MSTKIYCAWRVQIKDLNSFIDFVRPQVYSYSEKIISNIMGAVTNEYVKTKKIEHPYFSEERIKIDRAIELCRDVSKQDKRSPRVDIDFSLNIWLYRDSAYIIPIGEYKNFEVPDFSEEYGYWNNTDRPEEVTEKQWEERCDTWDKINLGQGVCGHNTRRLNHAIIDLSARYGDFDFEYEMVKRLLKKELI